MPTKFITIPGFKGGLAASLFDPVEKQTYQSAKDLDVFMFDNLLRPTGKFVVPVYNPTTNNSKFKMVVTASNDVTYFFGTNASNQLLVYRGAGVESQNLTLVGTGAGVNTAHQERLWAAELNGYLLFYSNTAFVGRIKLSDHTFAENPYSFSPVKPGPIFTHEGLQKIFIAGANEVYYFDSTTVGGSTSPTLGLTLDSKYNIKSLTSLGRFVLVGASVGGTTYSTSEFGESKIFVWDGVSSTVDDEIGISDMGLRAIRNVNGRIYVLSIASPQGEYKKNAIRIYGWSGGGGVELLKELPLNNTNTFSSAPDGLIIRDTAVDVRNGKLFFIPSAYEDGNSNGGVGIPQVVYAFGEAPGYKPFLTPYKAIPNLASDEVVYFLRFNKSSLVVAHTLFYWTTFYIHHDLTTDFSDAGVYESNAIALNGGLPATLKKIYINHKPIPTNCGFTVAVKYYGHYPFDGTVPSEDSYTDLTTSQGSGSTTGKTQSTDNATYTEIPIVNPKKARYAQIKISFDEVSGTNAPEIVFPILLEVEI